MNTPEKEENSGCGRMDFDDATRGGVWESHWIVQSFSDSPTLLDNDLQPRIHTICLVFLCLFCAFIIVIMLRAAHSHASRENEVVGTVVCWPSKQMRGQRTFRLAAKGVWATSDRFPGEVLPSAFEISSKIRSKSCKNDSAAFSGAAGRKSGCRGTTLGSGVQHPIPRNWWKTIFSWFQTNLGFFCKKIQIFPLVPP